MSSPLRNLRLLTLIIGLVYVTIGVTSPLLTLYLEELGASYATISLVLTSVAVASLIGNYAWGRLSDRMQRRKPILLFGLTVMVGTYALLSQIPNAAWAWIVLVINGAALAAYTTPSLALVGDLLATGGRRGRHMGFYRGVASLTFAGGAVLGGRLADATSIATALALCAGIYALAALLALWLHEPKPVQARSGSAAARPPVLTPEERVPVLFLAGVVFWVAAVGAAASMWPNYLSTLGYSKTAISSLWGAAALTEVPAMALTGALSDAIGRVPLLVAGGVGIGAVMIGYVGLSHLLPALAGVQILRGFGYASYTASAMTVAAEWGSDRSRGHNSGAFNASTGGGQILGTLMGGTIAQTLGFGPLFAVCAGLALVSALFFWLLRGRKPSHVERAEERVIERAL